MAKSKLIMMAAGLAAALTAWHGQSASDLAWAGTKAKQEPYEPSETTLEQNVKDAHTIYLPPVKGEVDIKHLEGQGNYTIFPDTTLKTPTIELPSQPLINHAAPAARPDPNHGERENEALARGHSYLALGPQLLITDKEKVVETPFGEVHVEPSSIVLIVCNPSTLAVFDLHDGSKKAITIHHHDTKPIELLPGQALVIANGTESAFEEINPAPWVMYRRLSMTNKELPEFNVFRAQFNMGRMITGFPQLKSLSSSDDPAKKKAMANLLKTAAIMDQVSGGIEPYQYYLSKELRRHLDLERQKQQQ